MVDSLKFPTRSLFSLILGLTALIGGANSSGTWAGGEFPLGLTYGHLAEQSVDKGAPMNWVGLQPVPVDLHPVAIGKNAPHPNAAKLFYDYLLSEEGRSLIKSFRPIPPRSGMESDPRRLTQGLKLLPVAPELAPKYGKYVNQFDSIFKK